MPKKRTSPPLPALFDEEALEEFLLAQDCPEPKKVKSIIYRVAVRALRSLPDPLETTTEEDYLQSIQSSIQAWRNSTHATLSRRRDVPAGIPDALLRDIAFLTTKLISNVDSSDGGTSKLLIETHDGHRVEAVVIRRHGRATSICVSSQVGCQMGCQFCATGTMGMIGNLTASEILEQAVYRKLAPSKLRSLPLKNIVFMGMGEPLNNFRHVKAAVLGFTDFSRFGLGRAHITVSTVGVVPYMLKLNEELPGVPLALSLHAPNQKLREKIVPAAKAWPLTKLMDALDAHIENVRTSEGVKFTGVMVEYVLLSGVNDLEEHAHQLAALLNGKPVLINLIPYNPNVTAEMYGFKAPTRESAYAFGKVLIDRGLHARVRIERGSDIAAACGQLALRSKKYEGGKESDGLHKNGGGKKMSDIEDLFQGGSKSGKSGSRSGVVGVKARGGKARRREKKTLAANMAAAEAEAEKEKHLSEEAEAAAVSEEKEEKSMSTEVTKIFGMSETNDASTGGEMWMIAAAVGIVSGLVVAQMVWRRRC